MINAIIGTLVRIVAAGLLALAATVGLTACADQTDGTKDDSVVEDTLEKADPRETPTHEAADKPAYEGPYDANFRKWIDEHDDSTVAVSGTVEKVISDNAFTLAGAGDDEDLLVVGAGPTTVVKPGAQVTVTGDVYKAFNLPMVEDEIKVDFEDDAVFKGFDRDPYVEASSVSTTE